MKKTLITTTLTAALALTACSTPEAETESAREPVETTPSTEPLEEPTPQRETSERGSIIKEPGEAGFVEDRQGNELITFTVHSIEVDPECTGEWAEEPENGTFVVFDMEIESDAAAADHYLEPDLLANPHMYRVVDQDGTTRSESLGTNAAFSCLPDSEQVPMTLGPGERGTGKMVLDVPVESGTLIMGFDVGEGLQWEWEF